jgi:hypothetical protein
MAVKIIKHGEIEVFPLDLDRGEFFIIPKNRDNRLYIKLDTYRAVEVSTGVEEDVNGWCAAKVVDVEIHYYSKK